MTSDDIVISQLTKKQIQSDENRAGVLSSIAIDTWGEPKELFAKSLAVADVLFVAKYGERIIAFATGDIIDGGILYLHATVVHKDFGGLGIYRKLNNKVIATYISKRPYRALSGFWCAFRTLNPSLYDRVYKFYPLYPDYKNNRKPTNGEQNVFRKIWQLTSPQCEVDVDNFVIKSAYHDTPGLIWNPDVIPLAKNNNINDFFEEKLSLSKMNGDIMVCVGRINPLLLLKYFSKNK